MFTRFITTLSWEIWTRGRNEHSPLLSEIGASTLEFQVLFLFKYPARSLRDWILTRENFFGRVQGHYQKWNEIKGETGFRSFHFLACLRGFSRILQLFTFQILLFMLVCNVFLGFCATLASKKVKQEFKIDITKIHLFPIEEILEQ